jgi:hypothetical protein
MITFHLPLGEIPI